MPRGGHTEDECSHGRPRGDAVVIEQGRRTSKWLVRRWANGEILRGFRCKADAEQYAANQRYSVAPARRSKTAELVVLGSGAADALERWNTGAAVVGNDATLGLIDCGRTAPEALRQQGWSLAEVREVFVSHVHGDHVHGLEPLGYQSRFGPEAAAAGEGRRRPRLILPAGVEDELWMGCLRGTMGRTSEGAAGLRTWFDVHTLAEGEEFTLAGTRCRALRVRHTAGKACYGIMVGSRILWTADTLPIRTVIEAAEAETIFHDCQIARSQPVHASLDELVEEYPAEMLQRIWAIGVEDGIPDEAWSKAARHLAGIAYAGQRIPLEPEAGQPAERGRSEGGGDVGHGDGQDRAVAARGGDHQGDRALPVAAGAG